VGFGRALPRPDPQEAAGAIGGTPTPRSDDTVDEEGEGVLDIIDEDQLFCLLV